MLSKDKKRVDAMIKADSAKRYNQLAVELLKKHLMGIIGQQLEDMLQQIFNTSKYPE